MDESTRLNYTGVGRDSPLLDPQDERAEDDLFPSLWTMSPMPLFSRVLRAEKPARPEFVTLEFPSRSSEDFLAQTGAVSMWNMMGEAAQFRRRMFGEEDLTPLMRAVADRGDHNVVFLPRTRSRYHEYSVLYHLLSRRTVDMFGLPLLHCGQWPFLAESTPVDSVLPDDFAQRLSRAWGSTVWRGLVSGSPVSAFSADDPIHILAHNLDFWIPPVTAVLEELLRDLPEIETDASLEPPRLVDGSRLDGVHWGRPRKGGFLYAGKEWAEDIVGYAIDQADADGRLSDILQTVKSSRVEDDFSARWSHAKEDFERKLYRKRNKIKPILVELTDTIPVHSPEAEIIDGMLMADFMAILKPKEREIVILLKSGATNLTDIAQIVGYANHSAVSKRLARIRERAAFFFDAI